MKKYLFLFLAASALTLACSREALNPSEEPTTNYQVQIDPVLTKVTETDFENGDAIGLTVTRQRGAWASNAKLVFDSGLGAFAGDLLWYDEGADEAELFAYYPYVNLESGVSVPARFNVATDQQSGTSSSDLIFGTKNGVLPSAHAISMEFKHKLSRVVINVTNNAGYTIGGLTLKGSIPSADIRDFEVFVNPDMGGPADIQMFKASATQYQAIVVPQTVAFEVEINAAGVPMKQKMEEVTLLSGKQYTIDMIVNPTNIKVALSGAVANWENGGHIGEKTIPFEEHLDEGYFLYDEVRYNVVMMKDNKYWMAQNLAFLPDGFTPSSDLTKVTAGVFYPLVVNDTQTAATFSTSADVIAGQGYLYQAEVALGLNVGDLTTVEAAQALEGTQGICPPGWHVPTIAEIVALVGKAVSPIATVTTAPYYNGSNGSIALLNEDGFNMDAVGSVSIQDNTKTAGTFMGFMSTYKDRLTSSMFCGSSYAGVTYNTSGDETSGIKNLQFYGFMPMTNKASEADYTCNGTKVSYRIAAPLRCVRNAE